MKFGMGQAIPRVEDARLLTGGGRYTDDINLAGQACAFVVRSPHAHATIRSIDTAAAEAAPGVVAVLTGDDVAADGIGPLPCLVAYLAPLKQSSGAPMYVPPRPLLVRDRVRFVGDYVALVIAETRNQAKDAAELVEVDYDPLPPLVVATAAAAEGAPALWPDCPDNACFVHQVGDRAAVEAAFARADHVSRIELPVTRIAQNPMEPRAALGDYDRHTGRYTLYSGTQNPHDIRRFLAQNVFRIPETRLRVVSPDMGGAFGMRSNTFPEMGLVLWASRRLGRPIKWTGERSESFLADDHGRDNHFTAELALDKEGRFLALRARSVAGLGAYLSIFGPFPAYGNLGTFAGVYTTPAIHIEVRAVFTTAPPIGPYRGAGRPEAALVVESLVDAAAREVGIDRAELRRRNMIPPEAMPYQTALMFKYDSGEFERTMNMALEAADYAGFEARRAEARGRGRLRGLGLATVVEQSAGGFDDGAEIRFDSSGAATVFMGTHSHGQGHETVFRQLLADKLGLEFEQVHYVQGDTDLIAYGRGTFGSRSSGIGGAALSAAGDMIIDKGRKIAAHKLEAAEQDIRFEDGAFAIAGTDRAIDLTEVARTAFAPAQLPPGMEPGLRAYAGFVPPAPTFPNGCHICEIEIDPETGIAEIVRYTVVDDVGTVMNPLLLEGQIHGGIVQGLGQILFEDLVIDPDSGQILNGSFMDYCMPRADNLPSFDVATNAVPSRTNPLGIKGAGEAGTVGAMPSVLNAVRDALTPLGISRFDMPASPERLWRAIRDAGGAG